MAKTPQRTSGRSPSRASQFRPKPTPRRGSGARRALKSRMASAAFKKGAAAYDIAKNLIQQTVEQVHNTVHGVRDLVDRPRRKKPAARGKP